jgi:hypothetical protein
VEEPLTPSSDPMAVQRLLATATLAHDSTHYLHGHLLTILGFAELLQEEEAESGAKDGYGAALVHAGQRLRARVDALLYLLSAASQGHQPPRQESLEGVVREVGLGQEVTIECRVPRGRAVAVDLEGLRCLLRELLVLADPPPAITLALRPAPHGDGEWLDVACGDAPRDPAAAPAASTSAERDTELAVIDALAAALGGSCSAAPGGAGDLRVSIPLPEPTQPISPEGTG